uniref:Ribonuclease H-like domain-containing protein n=1 Tax=Tanacetum cinerariifolium TaxID=118510 RepID=A0A699JQQ1_TANCI|nr:ribonuclease H-like domain-containing protein [Tanacetum cinerariifolium]
MPPVTLALTLVEKLYAVHNITNLVLVKLDLDELNYSSWSYFFTIHCNNFNVLKHIEPKTDDASISTPLTEEWLTADSIVKSWIILTLSPSLQKRFIKINPTTACDAWERVEKLFQDNKRTRTIVLKGELRMLHMGDQSADKYFLKIDSLVTLLSDLGSDVSEDDIVTYAINGLSDKYGSLAQIIAHKDPFPNLATIRLMVSTEEMRLWSKSLIQPTNINVSAPQVLLAASNIPLGVTIAIPAIETIANPTQAPRFVVMLVVVFVVGKIVANLYMTPIVAQEPADLNWNMDTAASSHLNSSTSNLSTNFNSYMYPSVLDFWTRQILLRCDSTGDLYPVTSPSYPKAFLVSQHTWHQRLGHPGSDVLRTLVSNNFISCNKTKSLVLCHACQLGKHVRLPFLLSETVVTSPFNIIHSDL